MKHACYMSVENDCSIRLTCMLPCACYCLLDACNMHVTCALFHIGRVIESSSVVPVLFREVFSHPYISFFHLLVNSFSVIHIYTDIMTDQIIKFSVVTSSAHLKCIARSGVM